MRGMPVCACVCGCAYAVCFCVGMVRGSWGWRVANPRDPPCKCWCGGVLLSHTLPGAVPSPCRALASRFGMGLGVSPGPWPPQDFLL